MVLAGAGGLVRYPEHGEGIILANVFLSQCPTTADELFVSYLWRWLIRGFLEDWIHGVVSVFFTL